MKIKLSIALTSICLVLATATPSQALVVSDPGAYSRFAQMITKDSQKIAELKKQLQEQIKIGQNLSGNLKRGLGIDREIGTLLSHGKKITQSIQEIPGLAETKLDATELEDFREDFLDKLYDPEQHLGKRAVTREQREDYRQRTLKATIENSEFILARQAETMQRFEDLAGEVDQTQSLKDSTDLLNRLMTELLIIEQQQLELMAQSSRAQQALFYKGTQSEVGDGKGSLSPAEKERRDTAKSIRDSVSDEQRAVGCEFLGGC